MSDRPQTSPSASPQVSPQSRSARLDAALRALLAEAPELEAAAVVSFDGLPMASALPPGMDEDRVAAMSAALLSLGERAAEGLGRGYLSQVYVEGEDGTVFLVSADDEAVLVAVAAKRAKLGMMLFEVRRAAKRVAQALRDDDAAEAAEASGAAEAAQAPVVQIPQQHVEDLPLPSVAAPGVTAEDAVRPAPPEGHETWESYFGVGVPTSNHTGGAPAQWS